MQKGDFLIWCVICFNSTNSEILVGAYVQETCKNAFIRWLILGRSMFMNILVTRKKEKGEWGPFNIRRIDIL